MVQIVVIGAGQAGAALVAKLRSGGYAGKITLIGEEAAPPYQRPPLSKAYLMGEMAEERLYLRSAEYYASNDIKLMLGKPVSSIDAAAKTVTVGGRGEAAHSQRTASVSLENVVDHLCRDNPRQKAGTQVVGQPSA